MKKEATCITHEIKEYRLTTKEATDLDFTLRIREDGHSELSIQVNIGTCVPTYINLSGDRILLFKAMLDNILGNLKQEPK